ncbi:hypothetical protein [Bradyrhizobium elkanii]|uniref:hypothetical protein n=1 Tax=Bradyrhizobium elkanii TaxID=29448 RepID=UPI00114CC636|nr:hypothetical protein [Bradyrhizobium elkanii]
MKKALGKSISASRPGPAVERFFQTRMAQIALSKRKPPSLYLKVLPSVVGLLMAEILFRSGIIVLGLFPVALAAVAVFN